MVMPYRDCSIGLANSEKETTMWGRKAQLIAELQMKTLLMGSDLIAQDVEIQELKSTRIRISVPTELGVKPVYDVPIEYAIIQSLFSGSGGLTSMGPGEWINGPVIVEVASQWRPKIERDDSDG